MYDTGGECMRGVEAISEEACDTLSTEAGLTSRPPRGLQCEGETGDGRVGVCVLSPKDTGQRHSRSTHTVSGCGWKAD